MQHIKNAWFLLELEMALVTNIEMRFVLVWHMKKFIACGEYMQLKLGIKVGVWLYSLNREWEVLMNNYNL